jgi:hypothetical protein
MEIGLERIEKNNNTHMIFIDFAKAYDSINHKLLEEKIDKLEQIGKMGK